MVLCRIVLGRNVSRGIVLGRILLPCFVMYCVVLYFVVVFCIVLYGEVEAVRPLSSKKLDCPLPILLPLGSWTGCVLLPLERWEGPSS